MYHRATHEVSHQYGGFPRVILMHLLAHRRRRHRAKYRKFAASAALKPLSPIVVENFGGRPAARGSPRPWPEPAHLNGRRAVIIVINVSRELGRFPGDNRVIGARRLAARFA